MLVSVDHAGSQPINLKDFRDYVGVKIHTILLCFIFSVLPCKELDKIQGEIVILTNNFELYKKTASFLKSVMACCNN